MRSPFPQFFCPQGEAEARNSRDSWAHHKPIFARNLTDDLARLLELIGLRSNPTAVWVRAMEEVSSIIAERP